MGRGRKKKVQPQVTPIEDEPPAIPAQQTALDLSSSAARTRTVDVIRVPDPPAPTAVPVTRRSLRNQIRLNTQPAALPNYEEDDDDEEEEEEEEEDDQEVFEEPEPEPIIKPIARKKRFLKETTMKKKDVKPVNTSSAQSLSRLINKRVVKPPERMIETMPVHNITIEPVLNGQPRRRGRKKKNADSPMESQVAFHAASGRPDPASLVAVKMEVEEQERQVLNDPNYTPPVGPKKRGRKRKSEALPPPPPLLYKSMKREIMDQQNTQTAATTGGSISGVEDSTASPPKLPKQKRGRQSAATESITPRFPFCSICLSKSPPTDYIISHMSCPNEYQKMKRLFTYIYKDLKFPFLPFDLERENVFDYCDLPLCDSCIVIYKEIYDFYAQIETARDQLKTKVEEMVQKMQLSETNPVMTGQLKSIKNSPDSLMNKYCNFRRRFVMYRPGESRAELDGSCLIPATIARIRVINPTPKRTSSSQTLLTSSHFTPPPTTPTKESSSTATASTSSDPKTQTSTVSNGVIEKSATTNTDKNETTQNVVAQQNKTTDNISPSASVPVAASTNGTTSAEPKVAKPPEKPSTPIKSSSSNAPQPSVITKPSQESVQDTKPSLPSTSSSSQSSDTGKSATTNQFPRLKASKPMHTFKVIPILPVKKPGAISSAVTIASPGRSSIFSKMPLTIPGTAASNKGMVSSPSVISPETSAESTVVPIDVVKQEPMEAAPEVADESDPFFSTSITDPCQNKKASSSAGSTESVIGTSSSKDDQPDTNVFRKHKKLRILSIPPEYEEPTPSTSSDATDSTAAKEKSEDDSNKMPSENAAEPCVGTSSSNSVNAGGPNEGKSSSTSGNAGESSEEKSSSTSGDAIEPTEEKSSSTSGESDAEKLTSKPENAGESNVGKASSETEATKEDKNLNPTQED